MTGRGGDSDGSDGGDAAGGRTGSAVAEEARAAVHRLVSLDAAHGARAALPAVREALRRSPGPSAAPNGLSPYGLPPDWLSPDGPPGRGSEPLAALAELYEVAGWILFDAGRARAAQRMNARALRLAERSGDRWTARLVLLNSSMLLAHTGRPRAALEAADRAAAGPRPLPPRVAALVLVRRAHAVAALGAAHEATALMARARSAFLDGVSDRDPHWAWWIDEPELLGHDGWVRSRLGHWDPALALLREAVAAPGPSYRHLFGAELLAATAGAGAWRDAERLIADLTDPDLIDRDPTDPGPTDHGLAAPALSLGSARTAASLAATAARLARLARRGGGRGHRRPPPSLREAAVHLLESLSARPVTPRAP